ncbi:IclR family transcriptional regulator [Microbacterium sp. 179-I 3D3 NHS]|uniref:IclR family transcriptional regulator n=1 Tax=unclassified Microbacterium TaxID=2609290 RepID=UPI00399F8FEA
MVEQQPEYAAPAVDKALDILETLAAAVGGLSQLDIAKAVSRSPGQIFRVLLRLEKRGYVYRDVQSGLYQLSMRLFDLAHRQEPLRSLITAAIPAMRRVAESTRQSCNLGVIDQGGVRIIAQVESPDDFGFHVRVGALFPLDGTPSGHVLTAFSSVAQTHVDIDEAVLAGIRHDRSLVRPDSTQPGITDIVHPILRSGVDEAIAALTVPYIATSYSRVPADDVSAAAERGAREIERALGI